MDGPDSAPEGPGAPGQLQGMAPAAPQEDPAAVQSRMAQESREFAAAMSKWTDGFQQTLRGELAGVDMGSVIGVDSDTVMDRMMELITAEITARKSNRDSDRERRLVLQLRSIWLLGLEPQLTHMLVHDSKSVAMWRKGERTKRNKAAQDAFIDPEGTRLIYQLNLKSHLAFNSYSGAMHFLYAWFKETQSPKGNAVPQLFESGNRKMADNDEYEAQYLVKLHIDMDGDLPKEHIQGALPVPPDQFTEAMEPSFMRRAFEPLMKLLALKMAETGFITEDDLPRLFVHISSRHRVSAGKIEKISYHATVDVFATREAQCKMLARFVEDVARALPGQYRYVVSGSTVAKKQSCHVRALAREHPELVALPLMDFCVYKPLKGQFFQALFSAKVGQHRGFCYRGSLQCATGMWIDATAFFERPSNGLPIGLALTLLHVPSPFTFVARMQLGIVSPSGRFRQLDTYLKDKWPEPLTEQADLQSRVSAVSSSTPQQNAAAGGNKRKRDTYDPTTNQFSAVHYRDTQLSFHPNWDWVIQKAGGTSKAGWIKQLLVSSTRDAHFVSRDDLEYVPMQAVDSGALKCPQIHWFTFGINKSRACPMHYLLHKKPTLRHHDSNQNYVFVAVLDENSRLEERHKSAFMFMRRTDYVRVWVQCLASDCSDIRKATSKDPVHIDLTRHGGRGFQYDKRWVEIRKEDIGILAKLERASST